MRLFRPASVKRRRRATGSFCASKILEICESPLPAHRGVAVAVACSSGRSRSCANIAVYAEERDHCAGHVKIPQEPSTREDCSTECGDTLHVEARI